MQQVKIFKSVENELNTLEAEMNTWIASSGARIISISGNIAPQSAGALESKIIRCVGRADHRAL